MLLLKQNVVRWGQLSRGSAKKTCSRVSPRAVRENLVEPRGIGRPNDHFVVALIGVLEGLGSNMSVKR
jgi:hypothetical protein